ncbi:hypothetical protein CYMTET_50995, partial [Cymbomonas tetramitiformis]
PAWLTNEYEALLQHSGTPASRAEKSLLAHIKKTYPTAQVEYALLVDGFDLDLYFPELKVNVEVDGAAVHGKTNSKQDRWLFIRVFDVIACRGGIGLLELLVSPEYF